MLNAIKTQRPWGWFETLAQDSGFHIKRIVVKPQQSLSLQSHAQRAEHWIVIQGTATVTVGERVHTHAAGSSDSHVYIAVGEKHRLQNHADTDITLIEVQTGNYFGEDDIVRYADVYNRV